MIINDCFNLIPVDACWSAAVCSSEFSSPPAGWTLWWLCGQKFVDTWKLNHEYKSAALTGFPKVCEAVELYCYTEGFIYVASVHSC